MRTGLLLSAQIDGADPVRSGHVEQHDQANCSMQRAMPIGYLLPNWFMATLGVCRRVLLSDTDRKNTVPGRMGVPSWINRGDFVCPDTRAVVEPYRRM